MKKGCIIILLLPALLLVSLTGCTKSYHLNTQDFTPVFPKLKAPIARKAALYIPGETKEFAFSIPLRRWEIGEAVSSHMAEGLKAAFMDVFILNDNMSTASTDRIVVCSLGRKTELKVGLLVTSDHTTTIDLHCSVLNSSNTVLWEGSVLRSDTFNAGIIGQMLIASSLASVFIRNVDVAGTEDMFESILTSGSNNSLVLAVDQMMEKMVREGRGSICPECRADTDWRTILTEPENRTKSSED